MSSGEVPDSRHAHLGANVLHFARVLRSAGLPIGTDRALLALEALRVVGIESRADFQAALRACLIDRGEHRSLFDQAFHAFWKDPDLLGQLLRLRLPPIRPRPLPSPRMGNRRLSEALAPAQVASPGMTTDRRLEFDASFTWSDRERLRKQDFEAMSAAEWSAARRVVAGIEPLFARVATRRYASATRGERLDLRALLRDTARRGGDIAALPRRSRRTRPEPLVALIDISGSMQSYSRMFLHFAHALANGRHSADRRLHVFTFGTRLTHITRQLRHRDPDEAIGDAVRAVDDWAGGTRIAQCLKAFNQRWARRVLSDAATVLLVSDGLEHAEIDLLAAETARLARGCRRIIWLNPLLRYPGFEPQARGVRAILPHVERVAPVHSIESFQMLARALSGTATESRSWN
jgi:uncharacterized protein with von Willebrand factor type A (vWA) domain